MNKERVEKKQRKRQNKRSHGAVTIFLTLILVPCLIFVCAFGDASRVYLSKAQATEASDLALYSLMANYDVNLKEWYGLVSSVKDIDGFYEVTGEYFSGMMDAAGLDGKESELFLNYLDALMSDQGFTDFLQVEIADGVTVDKVANAELGQNPALIEDGIVEFMKYRGPVEITAKLIDRLGSLDGFSNLKDASKDEPIVEAKKEYAEKEGEVLEELLYTYIALSIYQQTMLDNRDTMSSSKILSGEYGEKLQLIREDFKEITRLITSYYAPGQNLQDKRSLLPSISYPSFNYDGKDVHSITYNNQLITVENIGAVKKEKDPDDTSEKDVYEIGAYQLQQLINPIDGYISNIENASKAANEYMSSIHVPDKVPYPDNDVNPVVYCLKVQNALNNAGPDINTLKSQGISLMTIYAKLMVAQQCEFPEVGPGETSWETRVQNAKNRIQNAYAKYLVLTSNPGSNASDFSKRCYDYCRFFPTIYDLTSGYKWSFSAGYWGTEKWSGQDTTIGDYLKQVRQEFVPLDELLDEQIKQIDLILNGGDFTWKGHSCHAVSLETLNQKMNEYVDARTRWGSEAKAGSTDYADKEVKEYEGEDENSLAYKLRQLQRDVPVDELRTRLTNIRDVYKNLKDSLDQFTYGGVKIISMSGRQECIDAAINGGVPTALDRVSPNLSKNTTDAGGYYQQLIKPLDGAVYTPRTPVTGKRGNDPDIDTDPPDLYYFMKINLNLSDLDDAVTAKEENEKSGDAAKEAAEEASKKSKGFEADYLNDLGKDPSGNRSNGTTFGALEAIDALVGVFETLMSGNLSQYRDQLYVVEYAMDMFSYSSKNNEGQYNLHAKDNKDAEKQYTLSDYDTGQHGFPSYMEKWAKEEATDIYGNQSLTNRPINSNYNHSNLAEVEYILYGQSSNEENLKKAYEAIYKIRLLVNLVSGFQNFYSSTDMDNLTALAIETIAETVMGVTMGIVPAPLTKVIIIGILAIVESSHDLTRLKAGVPVAIYKYEFPMWFCKLPSLPSNANMGTFKTNLDNLISGKGLEEPDDYGKGLFYSDYLYLFLTLAANSGGFYNQMLLRIGDLIEMNMRRGSGADGDFNLDKCISYFQLEATVRVKPLFMALPIANSVSNVDATVMTENNDWCTYKVTVIRGYS